jgi:hypothetical protein
MRVPRDEEERNGAKCINNFLSKFCKMIFYAQQQQQRQQQPFSRATKTIQKTALLR